MRDFERFVRRVGAGEDTPSSDPAEEKHGVHYVIEGGDAETVAFAEAGGAEAPDEFAHETAALVVGDCAGWVVEVVVDLAGVLIWTLNLVVLERYRGTDWFVGIVG
jgi:hypothetical protein